jgi:hypothetical protein
MFLNARLVQIVVRHMVGIVRGRKYQLHGGATCEQHDDRYSLSNISTRADRA